LIYLAHPLREASEVADTLRARRVGVNSLVDS
jgi:hypothetical protein